MTCPHSMTCPSDIATNGISQSTQVDDHDLLFQNLQTFSQSSIPNDSNIESNISHPLLDGAQHVPRCLELCQNAEERDSAFMSERTSNSDQQIMKPSDSLTGSSTQLPSQGASNSKKDSKQPTTETDDATKEGKKRSASGSCGVCGDKASGYHYNALTCEGCKGFFRRTVNKKHLKSCKFEGKCKMDTYTRRKCPECRLKKCKAVGMLEECLLTDVQSRSKRLKRKPMMSSDDKDHEENVSTSATDIEPNFSLSPEPSPPHKESKQNDADDVMTRSTHNHDDNLIEFVGEAFKEYASNPEIRQAWASYAGKSIARCNSNIFEVATAHVKALVDFTKKLPGFTDMETEDQIALLKGSVMEIMVLRHSWAYIFYQENFHVPMIIQDTGVHEVHFEAFLKFFRRVEILNLDDIEYGLLSAIILFDSDHMQSDDKTRIDQQRDRYITALKTYSESKPPKRTQIVAKIFNLITELQTLYDTHFKILTTIREKQELTPLLSEIWDLR